MLLVPVNQQTVFAFSGGALGPASWIHTVEPAALLVFWDLGGTWTENGPPVHGWFPQLGGPPAELAFGFSLRVLDSSGREGAASVSGTIITGWSKLWSDEKGLSCCGSRAIGVFTPLWSVSDSVLGWGVERTESGHRLPLSLMGWVTCALISVPG